MPSVGEVSYAWRLGFKDKYKYQRYVWGKCPDCGLERWIANTPSKKHKLTYRCRECSKTLHCGDRNYNWKGKVKHRGYVGIRVSRDDFFYPMAYSKRHSGGYVTEHRLVMAKHLGRCLHPWEIVHHRNGIRDDNRLENLQLTSIDSHNAFTTLEQKIKKLEERIMELESK